MPKSYIRDSHIVLLVFDNLESFEILKGRWYNYYKETVDPNSSKCILVGNKSETFGDEKQEIKKLGTEFAEEINAILVFCSAKNNENVDNLENIILTELKRLIDDEENGNKKRKISN